VPDPRIAGVRFMAMTSGIEGALGSKGAFAGRGNMVESTVFPLLGPDGIISGQAIAFSFSRNAMPMALPAAKLDSFYRRNRQRVRRPAGRRPATGVQGLWRSPMPRWKSFRNGARPVQGFDSADFWRSISVFSGKRLPIQTA